MPRQEGEACPKCGQDQWYRYERNGRSYKYCYVCQLERSKRWKAGRRTPALPVATWTFEDVLAERQRKQTERLERQAAKVRGQEEPVFRRKAARLLELEAYRREQGLTPEPDGC